MVPEMTETWKTYTLSEYAPDHRGVPILAYYCSDVEYEIEGIEIAVVKVRTDGKWWIVANCSDDDDIFDDIGPFDDEKEAALHVRLMGIPV